MKNRAIQLSGFLLGLTCAAAGYAADCAIKTIEGEDQAAQDQIIDGNFTCLENKLDRILGLLETRLEQQPEAEPGSPTSGPLETVSAGEITLTLDTVGVEIVKRGTRGQSISADITLTNNGPKEQLALFVQNTRRQYTHIRVQGESKPRMTKVYGFAFCQSRRNPDAVAQCSERKDGQWGVLSPGVPYTFTISTHKGKEPESKVISISLRLLVKDKGAKKISYFRDFTFNKIGLPQE